MKNIQNDQRGMAAIVITVVLMLVISLITLGFAQTVRREQRNALDYQLSKQAYYAAESGINLADKKIKEALASGDPVDKSDCSTGLNTDPPEYIISDNAKITCLLVQPKVPDLTYQKVGLRAQPMLVKSTSDVSTITINWQATASSAVNNCGAAVPSDAFPKATAADPWDCSQTVLRVDVVPLGDTTALQRSTLITNQFTTFLYPVTTAAKGTFNYSAGSTTSINPVTCTSGASPKTCTATINSLPANNKAFGVRIMSIYGDSDLLVTARNGAGPLSLIDQQVMIDVTARSADILRRIQVRTSLTGSAPDFALLTGGDGNGGVCKKYGISAGTITNVPAACQIP